MWCLVALWDLFRLNRHIFYSFVADGCSPSEAWRWRDGEEQQVVYCSRKTSLLCTFCVQINNYEEEDELRSWDMGIASWHWVLLTTWFIA